MSDNCMRCGCNERKDATLLCSKCKTETPEQTDARIKKMYEHLIIGNNPTSDVLNKSV